MRIPWPWTWTWGRHVAVRVATVPILVQTTARTQPMRTTPPISVATRGTYRVLDADEIEANELSITQIPFPILPEGDARGHLMEAAATGEDVYAYTSGGIRYGVWCIWYGPLAAARFDHNGRIPVEYWAKHWVELVEEAHGASPKGGTGK